MAKKIKVSDLNKRITILDSSTELNNRNIGEPKKLELLKIWARVQKATNLTANGEILKNGIEFTKETLIFTVRRRSDFIFTDEMYIGYKNKHFNIKDINDHMENTLYIKLTGVEVK